MIDMQNRRYRNTNSLTKRSNRVSKIKRNRQINFKIKNLFGEVSLLTQQPKLIIEAVSINREKDQIELPNILKLQSGKNLYKREQEKLVKCQSSLAYQLTQRKQLFSYQAYQTRQIASLTKIMTCYLSLLLIENLKIHTSTLLQQEQVMFRTTKSAAVMNGTRAQLKEGEWYFLEDLLYGTMLPSGNDAALMLSFIFGKIIYLSRNRKHPFKYETSKNSLQKDQQSGLTKIYTKVFIEQMNNQAIKLKMHHTNFTNPHGLSNIENRSTAWDIRKLCEKCVVMGSFMEICCTKEYVCSFIDDQCRKYQKYWKNSNKLIDERWRGIKTGITKGAGGCLACLYIYKNKRLLLIVLGCADEESRFREMLTLSKIALQQ